VDGDRANSWLRGVFAGTRHTVLLDPEGNVVRPPDSSPDTGAGARGKKPRPTVELNDLFRAAYYGVSPDDIRLRRWRNPPD